MDDELLLTPAYNYKHTCTYMQVTDEDEADNRYRQEMLAVFNMKEFEEDVMVKKIEQLTDMVNSDERFREIITKSAARYVLDDLSMGLMLLFNCDSFHLVHKCLQDFNAVGHISDANYELVIEYLEK